MFSCENSNDPLVPQLVENLLSSWAPVSFIKEKCTASSHRGTTSSENRYVKAYLFQTLNAKAVGHKIFILGHCIVLWVCYHHFGTKYWSHFQRCLALQDRTNTQSQNTGNKIPTNSAQHPRKARTSNKTEIPGSQIPDFWGMKPCKLVYRYQHIGVHYYMLRAILYHNTLKMQAVSSSKNNGIYVQIYT